MRVAKGEMERSWGKKGCLDISMPDRWDEMSVSVDRLPFK